MVPVELFSTIFIEVTVAKDKQEEGREAGKEIIVSNVGEIFVCMMGDDIWWYFTA